MILDTTTNVYDDIDDTTPATTGQRPPAQHQQDAAEMEQWIAAADYDQLRDKMIEIWNAEQSCRSAEAIVEGLKEEMKEAKEVLADKIMILRELTGKTFDSGGGRTYNDADRLLDWLKGRDGQAATEREIKRGPWQKRDDDSLRVAIAALIEQGSAAWETCHKTRKLVVKYDTCAKNPVKTQQVSSSVISGFPDMSDEYDDDYEGDWDYIEELEAQSDEIDDRIPSPVSDADLTQ